MSLENEARECLLAAVEKELTQALSAGDLNTAKPSDPDFRCDFVRWRHVLDIACDCLRKRGYKPDAATNEDAKNLLDKTMSSSLGYLVKLATPKGALLSAPVVVSAVAAVTLTTALAKIAFETGRRHRTS